MVSIKRINEYFKILRTSFKKGRFFSSNSSHLASHPVDSSDVKKVINDTIKSTEDLKEAVNKVANNLSEISEIYEKIASNNLTGQEKKDYEKIEETRTENEREEFSKGVRDFDSDKSIAPEKAKDILEIRQNSLNSKSEHLASKAIELESSDSASIANLINEQIPLKEDFNNKAESYKNQIKELEKIENKLETQENKELIKGSLIDDYADLSTEIIDIINFD